MSPSREYREKMIAICVPPLLVLAVGGLAWLPLAFVEHVLTVLTAWTCTGFSLAVLVGHCALGEE